MMNKIILIVGLLNMIVAQSLSGQILHNQWINSFGGKSYDAVTSVCVDQNRNTYIAGYFTDTMEVSTVMGVDILISNGVSDYFISKIDSSGNFLWLKTIGGIYSENQIKIVIDSIGNIYATAEFSATVDFDPGPGVMNITSIGLEDIFILKLDNQGNFIWAKNIGGVSADISNSIMVDNENNLVLTGSFIGTVDFDPNMGVNNLGSFGSTDAFLLKLDSSGSFLWVKQFGGTSAENGNSLFIDTKDNIYVTGRFFGSADFDPSANVSTLTSFGSSDIFILKLDIQGNLIWNKQIGGNYSDEGTDIFVDSSGNVYTVGDYSTAADFDPGIDTFTITAGFYDGAFINKLDSNGTFIWAQAVSSIKVNISSVKVDHWENVYFLGSFGGAWLDPSSWVPGSYSLYYRGFQDFFLGKIDKNGNFKWLRQFGGMNDDRAYGLEVDSFSYIYLAGYYNDTANFHPDFGNIPIISMNSSRDAVVQKIRECPNSATLNIQSCNTYISPSGNKSWSASGVYLDTLDINTSCPTILTIYLDIISTISDTLIGRDYICANDSVSLSADTSINYLYSWWPSSAFTDPNSHQTVFLSGTGLDSISLTVTDTTTGCIVVIPKIFTLLSDCVWPGDANNDGVANNQDLLPIGMAFGTSDSLLARANASLYWRGHAAVYNQSLPNGINYKYINTNGDSLINDDDTLAIYLNYAMTHNKMPWQNSSATTDPKLFISSSDTATAGDEFILHVILGDTSLSASDIYGLAFSLEFDPFSIEYSSMTVDFSNSWLLNNSYGLTIDTVFYQNGRIDIALVRTDKSNVSGNGEITSVSFKLAPSSGLNSLNFHFTDVKVIDKDGNEKPVNVQDKSIFIALGNTDIEGSKNIKILPNPTSNYFIITSGNNLIYSFKIYDLSGRLIKADDINYNTMQIDVSDVIPGMYIIYVESNTGIYKEKLIITR